MIDLSVGSRVVLGGFQPMSVWEEYVGKTGVVEKIGDNAPLGKPVSIRMPDGVLVNTRIQYIKEVCGDD